MNSLSDLYQAIVTTALRDGDDEFTAAVPSFIRLAESRINRRLRTHEMEKRAELELEGGSAELPEDYLQYRLVRMGGNVLDFATLDEAAHCEAIPKAFTISGNEISVIGHGGNGDLTLVYYARIPALTPVNTTNWLLKKAPELYLYGALIEAAPFQFDDQRLGTWGANFDLAMTALEAEGQMAVYANAASRIRGATP